MTAGVIEIRTCWSPRWTTHAIVWPLLSRIAAVTWSHVGHGPAVDGDDAVAFLQSRRLGRCDGVPRLALRLRHLEGGRCRRHAGREEPDLGGDLRQAVDRDDAGHEHDRDEEVHDRAAEHDDDLLRTGCSL